MQPSKSQGSEKPRFENRQDNEILSQAEQLELGYARARNEPACNQNFVSGRECRRQLAVGDVACWNCNGLMSQIIYSRGTDKAHCSAVAICEKAEGRGFWMMREFRLWIRAEASRLRDQIISKSTNNQVEVV